MKKIPSAVLLLFLLPLGYCAVPMKTVVSIEINLQDQDDHPLPESKGVFFDVRGNAIGKIKGKPWVLGQHHISWWTNSAWPDQSFMRPTDALKAKEVLITAPDCTPLRLPINLIKEYNGLSFSPHGGGPAYYYYKFEQTVKLTCQPK